MILIDGRDADQIGRVFEIATLEVSNTQFEEFFPSEDNWRMRETRSTPDCPVGAITFIDAAKYCNRLSSLESRAEYYKVSDETVSGTTRLDAGGYRLPTIAEWEFACGLNSTSLWFLSDGIELFHRYEWLRGNSDGRSRSSGLLKPNHHGLFDLYGNVMEWCDDQDGEQRFVIGFAYSSSLDPTIDETERPDVAWDAQ